MLWITNRTCRNELKFDDASVYSFSDFVCGDCNLVCVHNLKLLDEMYAVHTNNNLATARHVEPLRRGIGD